MALKRSRPLRRTSSLRRAPSGSVIPYDVRVACYLRSRGRCEGRHFSPHCTGHGAHLHHVLRRSQGGTHTEGNLMHLCIPCHASVHDHPGKAQAAGLLARSSDA